ncbi:hypothetical protein [Cupriavidus alkaliphilus]|uniref:Uncharacterized protein n=1 Tax=Cupriavidus alkaliphilus TaxID=942866 RepID=A0A7W4V8U1_9BURK|nr:hypothetical protein [Cupriavidus alkaliphilus]MBB3006578.1 hypothetical protein [Cupriavidus alkaliphilus]
MQAARLDRDWVLAERGLATVASLVLSLLYLTIYFFGRDSLPEKWVTDSNKMLEFLVSGSTDLDDSFAATAKVFSVFGAEYVNVVTATVGVAYLALASSRVASLRDLATRWLFVLPCMLLNLLSPGKETVVIAMSIVLVMGGMSRGVSYRALVVMTMVLYGCYALFIRNYYAMILVLALGIRASARLSPAWKAIVLACVVGAILVAPSEILFILQSPRDISNNYALSIGSDNRTMIWNLYPPTSGVNFIVNYLYAAVMFVLPVISFRAPVDLAMMLMHAAILRVALRGLSGTPAATEAGRKRRWFATLVVAHILVQFIFEPDLGSYVRHLTSVSLFLIPLLSALPAKQDEARRHMRGAIQ